MRKKLVEKHRERIKKGSAKLVKLEALKNLKIAYIPYNELFKEGVMAGLGWAVGATIGFVLISTLLVFVLNLLGGLPIIGSLIASIIQSTQEQLLKRTPIIPR
jgi:hypothetical protein